MRNRRIRSLLTFSSAFVALLCCSQVFPSDLVTNEDRVQEAVRQLEFFDTPTEYRGKFGKTASIPELVKAIDHRLAGLKINLEKNGYGLYPSSKDPCPKGFRCFDEATLYRDWDRAGSSTASDPVQRISQSVLDSVQDSSNRLNEFLMKLDEFGCRCTPDSCDESIRGKILEWLDYSKFTTFRASLTTNDHIFELNMPEWRSLRGLLRALVQEHKEDIDNFEVLQGHAAPKGGEDIPVLIRVLYDRVSREASDRTRIMGEATKLVTDAIGKDRADKALRDNLSSAIVASGGRTQRLHEFESACWNHPTFTYDSGRVSYVLSATIETDIADPQLLEFLLKSMTDIWSGPVDPEHSLTVSLTPVLITQPPSGERTLGLTMDGDWPDLKPKEKGQLCDVIRIPRVGSDVVAAHELGHIFGFDHAFLDFGKKESSFEIDRIYFFGPRDIMAGGSIVSPRHRREIFQMILDEIRKPGDDRFAATQERGFSFE